MLLAGDIPEALLEPDVVIVGAGAVGLVLAVSLASSGKRVVLLEAGPEEPDPSYRLKNVGPVGDGPFRGLIEGRMKALGGTTRLWGGQLSEFSRGDFETLSSRHIAHSVYRSFRARCRRDAAFGSASRLTMERFGEIFGAGADAEVALAFLLAGDAAPESQLIFATESPLRLQNFLAAITKATRSAASSDALGFFCDRLLIAQDRG